MANLLDDVIQYLMDNWYFIVIILLGGLVIFFIIKFLKEKERHKRHSEVKEHHEIIENELKENKSDMKYLCQGRKKLGSIYSLVKKPMKEERIEGKTRKIIEKNYFIIGVRTMGVGIGRMKVIWLGKKHYLFPEDVLFFEGDNIHLAQSVNPEYYIGYRVSPDQETKIFTQTQFHRTMMDKTIDGMGAQMVKFSNVRDSWAHLIAMKEKDIERIKEEKRLATTKAR